jgi:hypothetical protein
MKKGRIPIFFTILIFLAGITFKALHPLYHNHEHESPEDVSTIQITPANSCYIDFFQFYQKDRVEPEALHFSKPPIFSKISQFYTLSPLTGCFIHYLLRGPPLM